MDSPIIEGNKLINPGNAVITDISYTLDSNGFISSAPIVKLKSNNFSKEYKIGCVYYGENKFSFEYDLNYCIIPYITNDRTQTVGGIILQSEKVHDSLFGSYINNEKLNDYSLVYKDAIPLAIYNGRIVGPISIWKINYIGDETNLSEILQNRRLSK